MAAAPSSAGGAVGGMPLLGAGAGLPLPAPGTSMLAAPMAVGGPITEAGEHALNSAWSFWFDKKLSREEWRSKKAADPSLKWGDLLRKTVTVDSVESFWRVYLHLKRPAHIADGHNVYMFRAGSLPAWEEYPYGGCWILKFKREGGGRGGGRSDAGRVWQAVLLALVGEACLDTDVVGVSLAVRPKEHLVSVWNRDNRDVTRRFRIASRLKTVLGLPPSSRIDYKDHMRSIVDRSTFANAQGFVFDGDAAASGGHAADSGRGGRGGRGGGRGGTRGARGGGRAAARGGGRGSGGRSWRTTAREAKP